METEQRRIVRVFLASPSDLMPERKSAREVVERLNKNWATRAFNLQIELMGWEETIGTFGRPPQDNIDADLAKCELFIGMLWYEWGSANTGKYKSGFEHEFRLAEEGHKNSSRPEIRLLFKQVDERRPGGAGSGYDRIKEFKEEIRQKVLWHPFSDDAEFRDKLEFILADYIVRLHEAEARRQPQAPTDDSNGVVTPAQPVATEGENPQLPREALTFLRDFADQASKDAETRPITPAEIARFRLLGTLISGHGNDEALIGVHDSNTLFVHANELSLAWREYAELAECGLVHFDAQNAPYWRWLIAANGFDGLFIPLRTVFGPEKLRIGAFKLLRLMQMAKFDSEDFSREFYVEKWLAADTPQAVRVAALGYLSEFGTLAELPKVQQEIDRADYQTLQAAIHAYGSILSRESMEKALQALVDHQSDSVEVGLLKTVFERPSMLPTQLLEQAVTHRASEVRRLSAAELVDRGKATREVADQLAADVEPEVRLQGLYARVALGDRIQEDEARAILVKRRVRSGFNALAMTYPPTEGESQLELFLTKQRERLSKAELRKMAEKATIFDQELVFEEIRRSFKTRGEELRDALKDGFAKWFSKTLGELEAIVGQSETLEKTKKHEQTLRKQWIREALAIVTTQRDCKDLPLVRDLIAANDELLTGEVVEYLAKCGEWADVGLILRFTDAKPSRGAGLLGYYMPAEEIALTARALLELGKRRARDLLGLKLTDSMKARIIVGIPPAQFRDFSDDYLSDLLRSDSAAVRRAAVLRSVALLPLARLKILMERHLDPAAKRYYNVGVWLDLGVSMNRTTAAAIAKRAATLDGI